MFYDMHKHDLAEIMAIERQAHSHPWSAQIFQDCLSHKAYRGFVWKNSQGIQAYGLLQVVQSQGQVLEASIINLAVKPAQQRQGLGRKMLLHLLAHSRAPMVYLEVRASNHIAIALYQKCGFHAVGMRRNYYPKNAQQREDALIFALEQTIATA